ncbi:MAG: hypothetical protein FJ403_24170 [Verrucomicrobia bacterium]|nr:hypothetical protein [Verrucomicrobiota bacterium]
MPDSCQSVNNHQAGDAAGLIVADISDPTNPKRMGGFDTGGIASAVDVVNSRAFIADGETGLQIKEYQSRVRAPM